MKIRNVKKRDGRIVPYDRSKITAAILKAMKAVDDVDETQAEILSVFVEDRLSEKEKDEFGIEEIQDMVIKVLMDSPFKDVAQEYTEYRYKRMMAKRASTNEIFKSIINAQANDITRENANMNADTPAGMMMKFASEAAKTFVDENLLSADVKKAVEDNILHIHDKDYFPTKSLTCIQHPQDEIFGDGFIDGHAIVRPVQRIESASMISAIEMEAVQNEMHGGQAIPAFDFYLAPFVRKSFEKEATRDGKRYGIPYERVLALKIKDYLDPDTEKWENILAEPEAIGDFSEAEMNLLAGAMSKTVKRVHQSMESFVHNMNTIHSRGGNQVVFSSINYGTDTSPEGRCIIREVLNTTYEGVGNGETAIFPIQIWKMKAGVSRYEGDPNYDLLQFAVRVTARRFFPNYLNLDASFNHDDAWKEDDPKRFEHEVATMGCVAGESLVQYRLMNTVYLETFEQMWKRMSYWFNPVSQKELGYEGGQYIPLDGVSIYDNGKWVSCIGIIRNPDKGDWMKVTFSDGRTITATSDHPWAVVEKDGKRLKETVTKTVALGKGDLMLAENPQKGKKREQYFLSVESVTALPAYHASSYDVTTSSEHFTVSGVRSHNCRTRVYENRFGPKTSIGRGNLSFSTLNLPGLAIRCMSIANRDMRVKQFFSYLSRYLDLTAKQLDERFQFQGTAIAKQFPVLMGGAGKGQGIWIGSKELGPDDRVLPVLNQGTLGIGFIGLAECLVALTGHHHGEDPEAQRLGLRIVEFMREKANEYSEKYRHNYSVLGTPAEGLSGRFTKIDRKKFGIIPGVTDRDYYTNSSHVPVWYKCTPSHKAMIEGPYHEMERGGHIFYVEMDGDATHNPDAILAILDLMNRYDIGYGSVNHNRNRCLDCGYEDATEGLEVCPKCGSHHIDRLQRITGYLVGTTDRWNSGKKAELYDRVTHTDTK